MLWIYNNCFHCLVHFQSWLGQNCNCFGCSDLDGVQNVQRRLCMCDHNEIIGLNCFFFQQQVMWCAHEVRFCYIHQKSRYCVLSKTVGIHNLNDVACSKFCSSQLTWLLTKAISKGGNFKNARILIFVNWLTR